MSSCPSRSDPGPVGRRGPGRDQFVRFAAWRSDTHVPGVVTVRRLGTVSGGRRASTRWPRCSAAPPTSSSPRATPASVARLRATPTAPPPESRRRPLRDRSGGPAGGRPGRPAPGRGAAGLRSRRRRGPARGVEGLHEGDAGRGGRPHRPAPRSFPRAGSGQGVPALAARPYVVKTDGLAAGKGVLVTAVARRGEADVDAKLSGRLRHAGRRVVIEEGLTGPEARCCACATARRLSRSPRPRTSSGVDDGDSGPNTGGMGAFSPVPGVDDGFGRPAGDIAVGPAGRQPAPARASTTGACCTRGSC